MRNPEQTADFSVFVLLELGRKNYAADWLKYTQPHSLSRMTLVVELIRVYNSEDLFENFK